MNIEVRHRPSFACIFAELTKKCSITAEADAMATMSTNVGMETHLAGGFWTALKRRLFGKESLCFNRFYLENGETGEVVLTQNTPGDIVSMELKNSSICLSPGAFIAYRGRIEIGTKWAGIRSLINGFGLFRLILSGTGTVWFGAYGGLMEKDVKGEYIVDTNHLVAYDPNLSMKLQLSGGIFSSMFSGEGLVTRLEGTGKAYIQTRSLSGLAGWINPRL